jgi:archaellum component FlaC
VNFIKSVLFIFLIATSLSASKKPVVNDMRGKLTQLKTSLSGLKTKLATLKKKLESLKISLNKKKPISEEPVTEKNIWDKIKNMLEKQNGKDFNLTPDMVDKCKEFDNQLSNFNIQMNKIKISITDDDKYLEGIDLNEYINNKTDSDVSTERAVMLFRLFCKKIGTVILDKTSNSYGSVSKRVEQLYRPRSQIAFLS